jgi:uncharacterized damage-inducible protein DinB
VNKTLHAPRTLHEAFIAQLDAEAPRTRRALEHVPAGHGDFKPHEKSMPFGRLAMLVAQMPSWISLVVNQDELDVVPKPGQSNVSQKPLRTAAELVEAHDANVAAARDALLKTSDAHLETTWKMLAGGKVVNEEPRYVVLRDTFTHLAHHRGQLTVYLRLAGGTVPSIYGPSADDHQFR